MNDRHLREQLKKAARAREGKGAPAFAASWTAATASHERTRKRRRRAAGVVAASALLALTFAILPPQEAPQDEYLIADALMNSTSWTAPSDFLLPEYQFDIYQDIPFRMESTNSQEGSLL